MKKITFFLLLITSFGAISIANAQSGFITTVAGNGAGGYSGDGGLATNARIAPYNVAIDGLGNLYIADYYNNIIRKVNSLGIISTFAGNGAFGFSGDGGPATAAELNSPVGIALDGVGNLYIADYYNDRIRKVDTSGIITTIAGNGSLAYSVDGNPATNVGLFEPTGVTVDADGNVYIANKGFYKVRKVNTSGIISTIAGNGTSAYYNGEGGAATATSIHPDKVAVDRMGNIYIIDNYDLRIFKVNSSGIITTFASNGTTGFSGDGGAAILAQLNLPRGIAVDGVGNIYIADYSNNRIRKVNPLGIITTIVGNGAPGFSGDGSIATASTLNSPEDLALDNLGNLYIADSYNARIRKVNYAPTIRTDSFSLFLNNYCSGIQFQIITNNYNANQHIKTSFGNGKVWDTTTTLSSINGILYFQQQYASSGIYTIKHILYNGTTAVDSVTYTQSVHLCQNLEIGFYNTILGSCIYNDSADGLMPLPVLIEVDSNSISIDTVSTTSFLFYTAYGNPGDIYSFRVINCPSGIYVTCPTTGNLVDTLFTGVNATKYFGFNCATSTDIDLKEIIGMGTGRHAQFLDINVSNAFCTPVSASLTLKFSPKYEFVSAIPTPTSFGGNTAIWDLSSFSYLNSPQNINVTLSVPGAWLIPGDTVITICTITPTVGDIDTTNNYCVRVDTVKSSFDPNEMAVMPSGCIPATVATPLVYTLLFENTGNDTAHNIYVLDTLPAYVVPNSLRIISSSNIMNTSKYYDTVIHLTIYKFEFPNINLLDSSHHNQCIGMVVFSINTVAGMPSGTIITNRVGIYFDDNPVVMTNNAVNVAGCALSTSTPKTTQSIYLYPNPATNQLTIKTDVGNYHTLTITGIVGQQILQQSITAQENIVDLQRLPSGIYYITLSGENGNEVRKFVKW